jgi:ribosomal protein S18 acetylase RimI-like enzyme
MEVLFEDFLFLRAVRSDADEIEMLYNAAKACGRENGTTDWDDDYPNRAFIDEDITNGALYTLRFNGELIATVSMLKDDDLEECDVVWTQNKACVLSRLCVKPQYQKRHVGEHVMHLITDQAKKEGYLATHHLAAVANPASLRLYDRMGYNKLGKVHMYDTDFYAYEKLL